MRSPESVWSPDWQSEQEKILTHEPKLSFDHPRQGLLVYTYAAR